VDGVHGGPASPQEATEASDEARGVGTVELGEGAMNSGIVLALLFGFVFAWAIAHARAARYRRSLSEIATIEHSFRAARIAREALR
jgi:hypothetical protein